MTRLCLCRASDASLAAARGTSGATFVVVALVCRCWLAVLLVASDAAAVWRHCTNVRSRCVDGEASYIHQRIDMSVLCF